MGSASSIEHATYDSAKFMQSKAVMESSVDDAEKFAKLKQIWAEQEAAAKDAAAASSSGADHKESSKDLHVEGAAAAVPVSEEPKKGTDTQPVASEGAPKGGEVNDAKPSESKDGTAPKKEEHAAATEAKKEEPATVATGADLHADAKEADSKPAEASAPHAADTKSADAEKVAEPEAKKADAPKADAPKEAAVHHSDGHDNPAAAATPAAEKEAHH